MLYNTNQIICVSLVLCLSLISILILFVLIIYKFFSFLILKKIVKSTSLTGFIWVELD